MNADREHLLIIRPGAIGDALLTFPVIQALRSHYTPPYVTFVSNAAVLPLAQAFGIVEETYDFGSMQWSELFSAAPIRLAFLRNVLQRTERAICWLRDPDDVVLQRLLDYRIKRVLVTPGRPAEDANLHVVMYLAQTADVSVAVEAPFVPPIPLQAASTQRQSQALAIHPGSGGARKCWPIANFAAVITTLWQHDIPVLLLAGPADHERLTAVLALLAPPPHPTLLKVLVDTPLLELAVSLQQCRGYLGNDAGITHLAALLGVPTLAVFGPSNPIQWRPIGPLVRVVQHVPLEDLHIGIVLYTIEAFFLQK